MKNIDDLNWQNELHEWVQALEDVARERTPEAAIALMGALQSAALAAGWPVDTSALNTPYRNTIAAVSQPPYPGNIEIEVRIENIIRWNAAAMVMQAQDTGHGLGGHIATFGSAATMMEVGFNHIFRAKTQDYAGDQVHFQAHAAPGVYARAMLEGRLSPARVANFRRELTAPGGLPSYPHPQRMPEFWSMPTASMGLSTPSAIYQARFAKYLEHRGLTNRPPGKVWVHIGDGESDEPEVLGTIAIAAREKLDNLVMLVNCNLQRLDGPVRGNGKIIQELERVFRGAGWRVIKVIWGSGWDPLFARDTQGILQHRMEQAVDGDYQMYTVLPGDSVREHWVEQSPELAPLMASLTDEEIRSIKRGGQDHQKIYAAYHEALQTTDRPTVILCKTVKGDGLGSAGANSVHQKKQLTSEERITLARRCGIPLAEEDVIKARFYVPPEDSDEVRYLRTCREALGGPLPSRVVACPALPEIGDTVFTKLMAGSGERAASTTMVMVRILAQLLRDPEIGRYVVPIVPDEARTFGMDGLFATAGIYSPSGQHYQPVDSNTITPYREAEDGQILQEGICETGAMASFMAAGTAYANHGLPMIPFYIFYSIFGFQRVGDMIWACADNMCRGFLLGGTSGRTTLNGEGVQHQDGHSQLIAASVPNLKSFDPAFGYELAIIVKEGIRRMYVEQEEVFYYITLTNQAHQMPAAPDDPDLTEKVTRGMYRFQHPDSESGKNCVARSVHLFGSGAIMQETLRASTLLSEEGLLVSVWSVTSYNELQRDALNAERIARMHPEGDTPQPYITKQLAEAEGVFVAASDYMKILPESISRWVPGPYTSLGTDGFGLSESRHALRDWFEVGGEWIAYAALVLLYKNGNFSLKRLQALVTKWQLDVDKPPAAPY